jgi:hypothetical protein
MSSHFSVHHLLPVIGAMMFDLKIIILATTPEALGPTAFGILGLVWPLHWLGTFIPVLPKKAETVIVFIRVGLKIFEFAICYGYEWRV